MTQTGRLEKRTYRRSQKLYFVSRTMHSFTKRARSSIFIFCCSARLSHSRIFCAFSAGIIFSGAVAFIRPGACADATCTNVAVPKDSAQTRAIERCLCIHSHPTQIIAKRCPEAQGMKAPHMPFSLYPQKRTWAAQPGMSALGHKETFRKSTTWTVATVRRYYRQRVKSGFCFRLTELCGAVEPRSRA